MSKLKPSTQPLFDDLPTPPSGKLPNTYRPVIIDGIRICIREDVYKETIVEYRKANR